MIRGRRAAIVLAAMLAASHLAVPATADEFSDFRIPDHRLFSWTATLSSDLQAGRQSFSSYSYSTDNRDIRGTTDLRWLHDNDISQTAVAAQARTEGFSQNFQNDDVRIFPATSSRSLIRHRRSTAEEAWSLALEQRNYPWRVPVGWQWSLLGSGGYDQLWSSSYDAEVLSDALGVRRQTVQDKSVDWRYDYDVRASVRWGYGKVRDATGVFEARIFEERLRQAGVLSRELSPQARQRLAELSYAAGDYRQVHDRPGQFLWREVGSILREDGALADSVIDIVGAVRALEPFTAGGRGGVVAPLAISPVTRMAGSFAGLVVAGQHQSHLIRHTQTGEATYVFNDSTLSASTSSFSEHQQYGQDEVFAGARMEYFRPLGLRWQFNATSEATVPVRTHRDGFSIFSNLEAFALLADRWVGEAYARHERSILRMGGPGAALIDDYWRIQFGTRLTFYLEDRIQLQADLSEQQTRRQAGEPVQRFFAAQLGLTYRLAGRNSGPQHLTQ